MEASGAAVCKGGHLPSAEEVFGISWRDAEGYRRPHGQGGCLEMSRVSGQ